MELKQAKQHYKCFVCGPLIVPYGIETLILNKDGRITRKPLIVPYGIETQNPK